MTPHTDDDVQRRDEIEPARRAHIDTNASVDAKRGLVVEILALAAPLAAIQMGSSLINVIGDPRIGHARLGGNLLGSTQVEG